MGADTVLQEQRLSLANNSLCGRGRISAILWSALAPTQAQPVLHRRDALSHYEHERLSKRFTELSKCPDDTAVFAEWIEAADHVDFLRQNAKENELVVCALNGQTFIQTAIVSEDKLCSVDESDLLNWTDWFKPAASYDGGWEQDELTILRGRYFDDSETLEGAYPLVFIRSFDSVSEGPYLETLQEYVHLVDAHWVGKRHAYCRLNELGDLDPVITITSKNDERQPLASFKREPLEVYLAASNSVMVRTFLFTLFHTKTFKDWSNETEKIFNENDGLIYKQRFEAGHASYTKGVQIIRPDRTREEIFSTHRRKGDGDDDEHVTFIAQDLHSGRVMKISTDPATTTHRGDTESSLPCELSPAFFRPEVLSKYKLDRDKYTVETQMVSCRNLWGLRYDVNESGQVHAYVLDLRRLPHQEKLHWLSCNEKPKAWISSRSVTQDFGGWWSSVIDPVDRVTKVLENWHEAKSPWWRLSDRTLLDGVNTPHADNREEWAEAFLGLSKLIVEGFKVKVIRAALKEKDVHFTKEEKSIVLLRKLIGNLDGLDGPGRLKGLRLVNSIRLNAKAHASEREARRLADSALREHGTYGAHFNHVCEMIVEELNRIEQAFASVAGAGSDG